MPELPEVELFRQLLLPLAHGKNRLLRVQQLGDNHPRIRLGSFTSNNDDYLLLDEDGDGYTCRDVLRKGKQLCLVLATTPRHANGNETNKYLYLHMGMTGRICVPGRAENWGSKLSDGTLVKSDLALLTVDAAAAAVDDNTPSVPPKYTHLVFSLSNDNQEQSVSSSSSFSAEAEAQSTTNNASGYTAYFCDPRKFGVCYISDSLVDLDKLAPDALFLPTTTDDQQWLDQIVSALSLQRLGIKAILLDQKRATSGVGNWVADEALYQSHIHPDQTMLTREEATRLWHVLQTVLKSAVHALTVENTHYPEAWLFHYRWSKKKLAHDAEGRKITFLTCGGRTSAVVAGLQKLQSRTTQQQTEKAKAKIDASCDSCILDQAPKSTTEHRRKIEKMDENPLRRRDSTPPFIKAKRKTSENAANEIKRKSPRLKMC